MSKGMKWKQKIDSVHPSHDMSGEHTEVRAPCGTSRWYMVNRCKKCEQEYSYHSAGKFFDDALLKPCVE
jgi:hypothetical protein